jgi:hypothetical protein
LRFVIIHGLSAPAAGLFAARLVVHGEAVDHGGAGLVEADDLDLVPSRRNFITTLSRALTR